MTSRGRLLQVWTLLAALGLTGAAGAAAPDAQSPDLIAIDFYAVTADGRHVLTQDLRTAKVFDLATGKEVKSFDIHSFESMRATYSADGARLAALVYNQDDEQQWVKVLDAVTGALLTEIRMTVPQNTFYLSGDGRNLYVAEQRGVVRVVRDGALLTAPVLDFRDRINGTRDRGLLDITVHPNFAATPYLYLLYTYDPPEVYQNLNDPLAGPDMPGNRAGRLTRVTLDAATNYTTIVPNSEVVLLGKPRPSK